MLLITILAFPAIFLIRSSSSFVLPPRPEAAH
jgi:hypothetical protein